jgi:hypothetical protein
MLTKIKELTKDTRIKKYITIGISQLIITIIVLWCYDTFFKQRIGVVNITGITEEFIKTQSRGNNFPEELKRRVHAFALSLEKELHIISARKKAALLPAEAVIIGAKDYTEEVQRYLSKTLLQEQQPQILKTQPKEVEIIEEKQ